MNKIPIFDSLTHPTIDGNWILPKYPDHAGIDILKNQMREAEIKWAFAVGMKGIGSYSEKEYINFIKNSGDENIYPIAFYEPSNSKVKEIIQDLKRIKKYGYYGIKLHPRISNFLIDDKIAIIIKIANDLRLIVMFCTYSYSNTSAYKITPESIMEMLSKVDNSKVILLHAGSVRVLEYMEIARAFSNVLLDLSLTICKYTESSIDKDLLFLFRNFNKRICVGSDHPEYLLNTLRERYEFFSEEISIEKKERIGFKNIINFCDLII
jgi:predicted TIM-barrel fold metal-dependent hydrolase